MSFSSPSLIDRGSTSLESYLRTRPLLDRAFLPGRLRVTEPCLRSNASLQIVPFAELGAPGRR